jgi:hypothetical protein
MDDGFIIRDKKSLLVWWKTIAFECGISPAEFRRCRMSDIEEIMEIKSAVGMKSQRNKKVHDLMNKVRFG